jgi:hypothetical protein
MRRKGAVRYRIGRWLGERTGVMGENIALGVLLVFALVVAALSFKPPAPSGVQEPPAAIVTARE